MSELDDHLPPPVDRNTRAEKKAAGPRTEAAAMPGVLSPWADRILFAFLGLLLGFTAAYLYLDKVPGPSAAALQDPHAGIPGVGPGATRDLPGSGGGAPSMSADPAVRQRIRELEEAVAKDPKNFDLLVKLGNAAYDAEDSRQAVDAYERALKMKGDDVNVLTDLGVSYRNLGDSAKALALFDKAVQINPQHWPAIFNQVIVYGIDRGEVAKAKALLLQLKKAHPEIPSLDKLEATLDERAKGKA